MTLLPLLLRHERLRRRRSPLWAVRWLRALSLLFFLYTAYLLVRQGLALPDVLRASHPETDALSSLPSYLAPALVADFWLRLSLTGAAALPPKAYALLPVPHRTLVHFRILKTLLSPYVLLWACLLIPFSLTAAVPVAGWSGTLLWWMALWLLVAADGLCCTALRLLLTRRFLWIALPAALHLALLWTYVTTPPLSGYCIRWSRQLLDGDVSALLPPLALTGGLYALCFTLFMRHHEETADGNGHTRRATFVPALLRTEWLMRMRSSRLRTGLLAALCCMLLLCLTQCASPETPDAFFTAFTSFYCYAVPVTLLLSGLPGHEMAWMDLLLLHRGSLLRLLQAKYLFCLTLLAASFVLLLPAVMLGRMPLMESLAQGLLTAGVLCPLLFALAPFQRVRLPLHSDDADAPPTTRLKLIAGALLFMPLALERLCFTLWGNGGWLVLSLTGLTGLVLSPLWLHAVASTLLRHVHHR